MLETYGIYQNHNDDCIGMVAILNQLCSYDVINSNTALKTLLFLQFGSIVVAVST